MLSVLSHIAFAFSAALALSGCVGQQSHACPPGQTAMQSDTLYFGSEGSLGSMPPNAWRAFLDAEVTPRFPQGLTVWPASGQWRSEAGNIVNEASYVLNIVHPDTPAAEKALAEMTAAFKTRFRQEAVLRVRSSACVSF
ncbi:MAG: DUF3574 domain-containing protein [Gammaproteobacteria bacterium]